jgi:hypothetical protein
VTNLVRGGFRHGTEIAAEEPGLVHRAAARRGSTLSGDIHLSKRLWQASEQPSKPIEDLSSDSPAGPTLSMSSRRNNYSVRCLINPSKIEKTAFDAGSLAFNSGCH